MLSKTLITHQLDSIWIKSIALAKHLKVKPLHIIHAIHSYSLQ